MALTADMGNVTISSVFRAEMVTKRGTSEDRRIIWLCRAYKWSGVEKDPRLVARAARGVGRHIQCLSRTWTQEKVILACAGDHRQMVEYYPNYFRRKNLDRIALAK